MRYVPSARGVMRFSVQLPEGLVMVHVTLPSSALLMALESTTKSVGESK